MQSDIINTYWYSIDWDVKSLWALDLPIQPFPVSKLIWHMDVPLWPDEFGPYRVTPRQVLELPMRFSAEYDRIQRADLRFPIDIIRRTDRWMILDGCHRLARTIELNKDTINIRQMPSDAVRWLT